MKISFNFRNGMREERWSMLQTIACFFLALMCLAIGTISAAVIVLVPPPAFTAATATAWAIHFAAAVGGCAGAAIYATQGWRLLTSA